MKKQKAIVRHAKSTRAAKKVAGPIAPAVAPSDAATAAEPVPVTAKAPCPRPTRSALAKRVAAAVKRDAKTPFGPRGQKLLAEWQADLACESASAWEP